MVIDQFLVVCRCQGNGIGQQKQVLVQGVVGCFYREVGQDGVFEFYLVIQIMMGNDGFFLLKFQCVCYCFFCDGCVFLVLEYFLWLKVMVLIVVEFIGQGDVCGRLLFFIYVNFGFEFFFYIKFDRFNQVLVVGREESVLVIIVQNGVGIEGQFVLGVNVLGLVYVSFLMQEFIILLVSFEGNFLFGYVQLYVVVDDGQVYIDFFIEEVVL